jgi:hypothetical protein
MIDDHAVKLGVESLDEKFAQGHAVNCFGCSILLMTANAASMTVAELAAGTLSLV